MKLFEIKIYLNFEFLFIKNTFTIHHCKYIAHYTIVIPLLILSKCSLALIRKVAIELVRMSVLCIVIFSAPSFGNKFGSAVASASVFLYDADLSEPETAAALGGDEDEVEDTRRIPLDDNRIP